MYTCPVCLEHKWLPTCGVDGFQRSHACFQDSTWISIYRTAIKRGLDALPSLRLDPVLPVSPCLPNPLYGVSVWAAHTLSGGIRTSSPRPLRASTPARGGLLSSRPGGHYVGLGCRGESQRRCSLPRVC